MFLRWCENSNAVINNLSWAASGISRTYRDPEAGKSVVVITQMGFLLLALFFQTKRFSLVVLVVELNIVNCKKLTIKWMANYQTSEILMNICGVLVERLLQIYCWTMLHCLYNFPDGFIEGYEKLKSSPFVSSSTQVNAKNGSKLIQSKGDWHHLISTQRSAKFTEKLNMNEYYFTSWWNIIDNMSRHTENSKQK